MGNLPHAGLLTIEKRRVLPSGSDALGRRHHQTPTVPVLAVVFPKPPMVGGRFAATATAGKICDETIKSEATRRRTPYFASCAT